MTLEDRARQAAAGVRESVQSGELLLLEAGVPGTRRGGRPNVAVRAFAFGGAFAAVVILVGFALLPGRLFAPDENTVVGNEASSEGSDAAGEGRPDTHPDVTAPVPNADPGPVPNVTSAAGLNLTITFPSDGEDIANEQVTFEGTVDAGSRVFARAANSEQAADVDGEGNWSITLVVNPGATTASFYAVDDAGNASDDVSVTVTYTPPAPATTLVPGPPEDDPSEGSDGG